jgi:hypothetical protein
LLEGARPEILGIVEDERHEVGKLRVGISIGGQALPSLGVGLEATQEIVESVGSSSAAASEKEVEEEDDDARPSHRPPPPSRQPRAGRGDRSDHRCVPSFSSASRYRRYPPG